MYTLVSKEIFRFSESETPCKVIKKREKTLWEGCDSFFSAKKRKEDLQERTRVILGAM